MKKIKFDPQEQKIIKDFEQGKYASAKNLSKYKKILTKGAKNYFKKDKNINIRINEPILLKLKAKAAQNGIPYQTLVSTILHQYVTKKLTITI